MISASDIEPRNGEIWHPWWTWEEMKHNMWGDVTRRKTWLQIAIQFTGDAELYGEWMMKMVEAWPVSCEHNLSKSGDKRPWVGHAAVAYAIGCPEDIVREAWGHLSEEQQIKANAKATEAIEYWRSKNAKT
jgi:hypothetical protein